MSGKPLNTLNIITLDNNSVIISPKPSDKLSAAAYYLPNYNMNVKPCDISHIQQFDGNMSVSSSESENSLLYPPPPQPRPAHKPDKIITALSLPTYNLQLEVTFPKSQEHNDGHFGKTD